jgi:hypothetical protein
MQDQNDIVFTTYSAETNIFKVLYEYLFGTGVTTGGAGGGGWYSGMFDSLLTLWSVYSVIAFGLSALFIFGIIYSYLRITEFDEEEEEILHERERLWRELHDGSTENKRWQSVQKHLASENPNDWKLAIIEADVLLEHMLAEAGFEGSTVADKLRSAASRTFVTLEDAWQAHRVRNQIAHGGTDFVLTHKVAKETLIQYERVFKEFSMI